MKILYSWLSDYVDCPKVEEVLANLKRLGFGVEDFKKIEPDCEGVVTAKVIEVKKHPNADRLKICKVTTGNEIYEVVCGAQNVKEDIIVPFAKVGSRLKNIFLKKAKIRGIDSNGMICSSAEIGLEEESDGIMILENNVPLNVDIREIFKKDYIIELEITPNLAYTLSYLGIARELSIFCGYNFKLPPLQNVINDKYTNFNLKIDTLNCLRYCGIVVKNIKNRKTPSFMMNRLKAVGLNPKGNLLIDLSNYIMFEIGQPNHFFDLRKIDNIVVRQAFKGERFKALDGKEYCLDDSMMVIADSKGAVAIAGVIGGLNSSIDDATTDVFVEIANFEPSSVRKTSKLLNIKTDSSYRFERGVDYNLVEVAARRIIYFLKQLNPDCTVEFFEDLKNVVPKPVVIEIDRKKVEEIIGIEVDEHKLEKLLKAMDKSFDGKFFNVPSYRFDISTIWDISEEYLRYVGYDSIESKSDMPLMKSFDDSYLSLKDKIYLRLAQFGLNECYTYDLVSEKDLLNIGFDLSNSIRLLNPVSKDFEYLRPNGLASMLKVLRYNINRDVSSVGIYEFGNVFYKDKDNFKELRKLFILLWGSNNEWDWWKEKKSLNDFFSLKSVVDAIFDYETRWEIKEISFLKNAGIIIYKGQEVGFAGEVDWTILKRFDIKERSVFYAEIDIDGCLSLLDFDFYKLVRRPKKPSNYQCGVRDLSIIVDKKYKFSEIEEIIKADDDIVDVRLIDLYQDKRIGEDKRSLTFRFIFSSYKKTFTDEELNLKIEKIFNLLKSRFNASLR